MKSLLECLNESTNKIDILPKLAELGDGEYTGTIWGNCFTFENKEYYSEIGTLCIVPSPAIAVVKEGEVKSIRAIHENE